jgi:hypothetical protein
MPTFVHLSDEYFNINVDTSVFIGHLEELLQSFEFIARTVEPSGTQLLDPLTRVLLGGRFQLCAVQGDACDNHLLIHGF